MIGKFLRVERLAKQAGARLQAWRTLPNCERLSLWNLSFAEAVLTSEGTDRKRVCFHIDAVNGLNRGDRVTYMGERFGILEIAADQKLRGIELRCTPWVDETTTTDNSTIA